MKTLGTVFIALLLLRPALAQLTEKDVDKFGSFKEKEFRNAPKKVFINSFNVYFQVFGSARASTSGGEMLGTLRGNTNVAMGVFLEGVSGREMVDLTTQVYNEYVAKLKDQGFEIVTADEAGETETLAGWVRKDGGVLNSAQSTGFAKVTPAGYSYFVKRETGKGKEKKGFFSNAAGLSKDLNDAIIADVNMTFYFVKMKTYDSEFIGYAKVTGQPDFHFARVLGDINNQVLTSTTYAFGKNLSSTVAAINTNLKKPLYSQEPVFDKNEKFKEVGTAASKSIPDYASVVFVNNTDMTASHSLPCDPELYKKETYRMMTQFLDLGLARLSENVNK